MWVVATGFHDGRTLHAYKQVDSQLYLHLDNSVHAYRFLSFGEGSSSRRSTEPLRSHSF